MNSERKVLAIIPARSGSKGIPNKNMRSFNGLPLIEWTFQAATSSNCLTDIILTSDSEAAISLAGKYQIEVPFRRPSDLSSDEADTKSVVSHAVDFLAKMGRAYSDIMILQPTSPLRNKEDIDRAWKYYVNASARTLLSVTEASRFASHFMYEETNEKSKNLLHICSLNGESLNPIRRQELKPLWWRNGAIYIFSSQNLTEFNRIIVEPIVGYEMEQERSINIDSENDWVHAEILAEFFLNSNKQSDIRKT